jgi:hypothetical protein
MAKANRDNALDMLVCISLWYVREYRSLMSLGVEAVRRNAGRHRDGCCIAIAPGGGAEQEEVRRLPHIVRALSNGLLTAWFVRADGDVRSCRQGTAGASLPGFNVRIPELTE